MVEATRSGDSLEALEVFIGEWRLVAVFNDLPPADAECPRHVRLAARKEVPDRALGDSGPGGATESRSSAPIPTARAG
jgi:hypothetical protein